MFSDAASGQLRELFDRSFKRFADNAPDITEPPQSLDETLQHGGSSGSAAPFHFALFPEIVRFKTLERSFSSALGGTFEEAALIIGRDRFAEAHPQHEVIGRLRATVNTQIEQLVRDYETWTDQTPRRRQRSPNAASERELIRQLVGPGGEDHRDRVDLFLLGHDGNEHYFHMKTVKPNRDQSGRAKQLMLRVYAMRLPRIANVFFGMAYNPYGEGNPYNWSFPKPYLDFNGEVLIGGAFWDYIGGAGAYQQLLTLVMGVGRNAHDQVIRQLGL